METNKKYFQKLVRDNVPQLIEESGRKAEYEILKCVDRPKALRNKLNEEVDELQAAKSSEEILEEAADVYEVLMAIIGEAGFLDIDLRNRVKQKRVHCGSFSKFIWLESAEIAEQD